MESYIVRQQVREINRKLFANDLIYSSTDIDTIDTVISRIITSYNPADELASIPTLLRLEDENLTNAIYDKITLLNIKSVIVQVNNRIFADPDKVQIVRKLKDANYKIMVEINKEDYIFTLAKIFADYIKFDIKNIPDKVATQQFNCKKLAYNVNTPEDYVLAEAACIDLYEGTYISPTTEIEVEDTQHSKVNFIEIISTINRENCDIKDLANIIKRDSLMSAQLIRLSNSAYFAGIKPIESISDAIVRVGLQNLKKWIFLLQFSRNNNVPEELLQTSYHRAVFCEIIIHEYKNNKEITSNDAYLIGLFSTLDILTGKSMNHQLTKMNLNDVVEDALIYRDGIGGTLLNLVRAYEEANWKKVDKYIKEFKLNKEKIFKIYFDSLEEVTKLWKNLTEFGGVI